MKRTPVEQETARQLQPGFTYYALVFNPDGYLRSVEGFENLNARRAAIWGIRKAAALFNCSVLLAERDTNGGPHNVKS